MASAAALRPGHKYKIKDGDFAGEVVTIKDNTPFPDYESCSDPARHTTKAAHDEAGCVPHPLARKVTVITPDGHDEFFLPRQILPDPIMDGAHAIRTAEEIRAEILATLPTQPAATAALVTAVAAPQGLRVIDPITDVMDPRLDHLRPSRRKVAQYQSRDIAPGLSDTDFLLAFTGDEYRVDGNNAGRPASVMLKGDTQSGKTMLVEVLACLWADRLGLPKPMPVFTISGSAGVTDFDLFGQTTSYTDPVTGAESLVWLPGMVELACQVGGILYLDEVNAIDPRFTSSLHPLIDHRHMFVNRNKAIYKGGQFMAEVTSASLDLWVVATLNESYAGMGKMNEAFINRFEPVLWGYNGDVEVKLIDSAAIRLLGDALRTARERNSIRTPVGTAALQRCVRNVRVHGPVVGLNMLTALFGPQERPIVESIIEDRSIIILLNEELRQAAAEAANRTP
jgi:hypothetical protein